jgi:hypothetical protein
MRNYRIAVALITLFGIGMTTAASAGNPPKGTKHQATKPVKKDETAEKLRQLTEALEEQKAALQQMQQQVQETQQQLQQTQQQLQQAQQTAQQADVKAATVETNSNLQVQRVQSDLSTVKTTLNATTQTAQKTEKQVGELQNPLSIAYKGLRLTPGGFLEMSGYFRSRTTLSDVASTFSTIPLEAQPNTYLTEFGESVRSTRLSLRLDGDAGTTKLAGFFEVDFFGNSPTGNPNQTSSYPPRLRQAWGRAQFADGWTITGGQMWNLITMNRKGTDADNFNLWIPNIIDAQYLVGYNWGRFAEIRASKSLGKTVSVALSATNPSYLNTGANAAVGGLASNGAGLLGNSLVSGCTLSAPVAPATQGTLTCTNTPTYSTNLAPDLIAKLAYDNPKLGHYEIKTLGRIFRDRVLPTATAAGYSNKAFGAGIGAGAVIPLAPKKVDFVAQGMYGKGTSRYQDSGQYDFVVRSTDHAMQPIRSFSAVAGFETHPAARIEIDLYAGDEYYYKTTYSTGTAIAGYGAPTAINTGCYYETAAQAPGSPATLPACTAYNRNLMHGTLVAYRDVYKGTHGTLRYGVQYEYLHRATWSGVGGAPKGVENGIFATMRYILP